MGFWSNFRNAWREARSGRRPIDRETSKVMRYNVEQWRYHNYDRDALEMDLIRASVDALSRNIAKMRLECVMYDKDGLKKVDETSDLARVLKHPNRYMTLYDFLYKVASIYYTQNNVFIWPEYDRKGNLVALWPINYKNFKLYETDSGILVAKFQLSYTRTYTVAYDDLIHLRNHYTNEDLLGDSNAALRPVCELLNAQNQGIVNGIRNSAIVRGILKSINVIKEEDMNRAKAQFIEENLRASNNGGVIGIDGKFEYTPIDSKPYIIDAETREETKKMVFNYFGVNEAFLTNDFTAEKYEAVYEGRLEPFAIMLTQALTHGLYTEREIGFRNVIEANMSKLKYQPYSTITAMVQATNQLGLFTRNEYREAYGYPPLKAEEGGNEIMISLNYTNTQNLDEYQNVGQDDTPAEEEPSEDQQAE